MCLLKYFGCLGHGEPISRCLSISSTYPGELVTPRTLSFQRCICWFQLCLFQEMAKMRFSFVFTRHRILLWSVESCLQSFACGGRRDPSQGPPKVQCCPKLVPLYLCTAVLLLCIFVWPCSCHWKLTLFPPCSLPLLLTVLIKKNSRPPWIIIRDALLAHTVNNLLTEPLAELRLPF